MGNMARWLGERKQHVRRAGGGFNGSFPAVTWARQFVFPLVAACH